MQTITLTKMCFTRKPYSFHSPLLIQKDNIFGNVHVLKSVVGKFLMQTEMLCLKSVALCACSVLTGVGAGGHL
jgi:hypothetical protein